MHVVAASVATLWREVLRARPRPSAAEAGAQSEPAIDYAACPAALTVAGPGGGAAADAAGTVAGESGEAVYDWEREGLSWTESGEIVDREGYVLTRRS